MPYHTTAYYNINCIQCMLQYCIMSRTQRTVHSELCNVCFVVCHRGSSVVYMHIIIGHNEYRKKNSRTKEEATETNALHIYFFIRFSCWNHMDDVRKHISLVMKHHTDDAAERTKYICSKRKIMTKNRRRKKSSSRRSLHLRSDAKAHNAKPTA